MTDITEILPGASDPVSTGHERLDALVKNGSPSQAEGVLLMLHAMELSLRLKDPKGSKEAFDEAVFHWRTAVLGEAQ